MENYIIVGILLAIAVATSVYLYRVRKRGQTCVGCPHAKQCKGKCDGNSSDNK